MSGMANQDEKLIIALLKTVVSNQISVRCDMEAATDIVGALARIDKDCWDNHPIITMRLTFANMKQKQDQRFTDFAAELRKQGEMADVSAISPAVFEAMILTNGCTDQDLLKEILKMKE